MKSFHCILWVFALLICASPVKSQQNKIFFNADGRILSFKVDKPKERVLINVSQEEFEKYFYVIGTSFFEDNSMSNHVSGLDRVDIMESSKIIIPSSKYPRTIQLLRFEKKYFESSDLTYVTEDKARPFKIKAQNSSVQDLPSLQVLMEETLEGVIYDLKLKLISDGSSINANDVKRLKKMQGDLSSFEAKRKEVAGLTVKLPDSYEIKKKKLEKEKTILEASKAAYIDYLKTVSPALKEKNPAILDTVSVKYEKTIARLLSIEKALVDISFTDNEKPKKIALALLDHKIDSVKKKLNDFIALGEKMSKLNTRMNDIQKLKTFEISMLNQVKILTDKQLRLVNYDADFESENRKMERMDTYLPELHWKNHLGVRILNVPSSKPNDKHYDVDIGGSSSGTVLDRDGFVRGNNLISVDPQNIPDILNKAADNGQESTGLDAGIDSTFKDTPEWLQRILNALPEKSEVVINKKNTLIDYVEIKGTRYDSAIKPEISISEVSTKEGEDSTVSLISDTLEPVAKTFRISLSTGIVASVVKNYDYEPRLDPTTLEEVLYEVNEHKTRVGAALFLSFYFKEQSQVQKNRWDNTLAIDLGLNISDSRPLLENFYLGISSEPIRNMSIAAGYNFLKTEKLDAEELKIVGDDNRAEAIDKVWVGGPYVALKLNLNIFPTLISSIF